MAGVLFGGSSAAIAGDASAKHNATAIAVARTIEAKLRSELLYIISLDFLVHFQVHHLPMWISSAPRLLWCRAVEQCCTLEVVHAGSPAGAPDRSAVIGKQGVA